MPSLMLAIFLEYIGASSLGDSAVELIGSYNMLVNTVIKEEAMCFESTDDNSQTTYMDKWTPKQATCLDQLLNQHYVTLLTW